MAAESLIVPDRINTNRFIIRKPTVGDFDQYFAAWFDSFEYIKPWFGHWAKEPPTREVVEASIGKAIEEWDERKTLTWLCFDRCNGELVGRAFFSKIEWDLPKGMLGYWVRKGHQGSGVGSEMVQALTDLAFVQLQFKRLELYIDPRNERGVRFADGLGFVNEGCMRNYSYDNFGTLRDYLVYAMTPRDYARAIGQETWAGALLPLGGFVASVS